MWQRVRNNASWSLVSLVAVALFGFAAMYFNARALGVEGLGTLAGVLALSLMLEALAGMQSWQAVLALSDGREGQVLGAALIINGVAAICGVIIGLSVIAFMDFGLDIWGQWAATLLIASQLLRLSDPLTGILRKHDLFGFLALVRTGTGLASLLMAAVFWAIAAPVAAYIATFALIYLVSNACLLAKTLQKCRPTMPLTAEIGEVFAFCLPAGVSGAIGAIRQRGIIVLLGIVSGTGAVGIYAVADRIAALLQMVYRAMFEAVFREMPSAARPTQLVGWVTAAGLLLSVVAVALAYGLGGPVIEWVAGNAFALSASTLLLLVSAICLSLMTLGFRALVIVKIGPRAMLGCNAFALLSMLAAPSLIAHYGAIGAAITQILFEVLWIFAVIVVVARNWPTVAVQNEAVEQSPGRSTDYL